MIEFWKDVEGYEGLYKISNSGKILSLAKDVLIFNRVIRKQPDFIMKQDKQRDGYMLISLYKNKIKSRFLVSILVAKHFVPNPDNFPYVNHDNGIKDCNWDWNLKWCTSSENQLHAIRTGLRPMKTRYDYTANMGGLNGKARKVDQLTLSGDYIKTFDCISDAKKEIPNLAAVNVGRVCLGTNRTAYGYKWRYAS